MSRPVHPFLFALFPLFFLVAHNRDVTSGADAIAPLLATLGSVLVLQLAGTLIFRNARKVAVVLSTLVIGFFSYGHIWNVFENDSILLAAYAILAIVIVASVIRTKKQLPDLTRILNIASVVLLATVLVTLGLDVAQDRPAVAASGQGSDLPQGKLPDNPRDIYYLIFDRYADAGTLKTHFGFDNSAFEDQMRRKGFVITPESMANYQNTHTSLAASLNMRYLDEIGENLGKPSRDNEPAFDMLKRNDVARFLQTIGYKFIHIGSWASFTHSSPIADVNLRVVGVSEFTRAFYNSTALSPLMRKGLAGVPKVSDEETQRAATRRAFDNFERARTIGGPKFVFAHFLVPHPPYVFDRHGGSVPEKFRDGNKEGYVEQVRFTNTHITKMVDELLAGPEESRPIVIVQADEGPYPSLSTNFLPSWLPATDGDLRVKFGIFNAYYLPGVTDAVYPSITPVNTFRIVLDRYFGTRLGRLPDRSYVSRNREDLYTFFDITERLDVPPSRFHAPDAAN